MREQFAQRIDRLSKRAELYLKCAADPKKARQLARRQHLPVLSDEDITRHYRCHGWQYIMFVDQLRKDDNER